VFFYSIIDDTKGAEIIVISAPFLIYLAMI